MSDLALVDTNVLVNALFEDSTHYAPSRALLDRANEATAKLCILPQNITEFYAAVTNPRRVTEPKTAAEALEGVHQLLALPGVQLLPVPTDTIGRLVALLARRPVLGVRVHDVHLVAAMLGNGVTRLYTFNVDDFTCFTELEVMVPEEPSGESS
jgi:predicted nucleic acid-binding protein